MATMPRSRNADAAQDRFVHAFVAANAEHVVRHLLEAERRRRLVRSAVTADIDRNDFEIGREMGDLVHPQVMVERICMNHDERKAFAGNFVVNFNAVGETIHDSSVPIVPAVPNDKSRENTTF